MVLGVSHMGLGLFTQINKRSCAVVDLTILNFYWLESRRPLVEVYFKIDLKIKTLVSAGKNSVMYFWFVADVKPK